MKPLRILLSAVGVLVIALIMALLSLDSGRQWSEKSDDVYVLEKDGFYQSLGFLEENAISQIFRIELADKIEQKKEDVVAKYIRSPHRQTTTSALGSFGLVPTGPAEKVAGSDVVLTTYEEADPELIPSEAARQATVFTDLLNPITGTVVSETDVEYFKMITASERVDEVNQRGEIFGIEVTPEMYLQFNDSDKEERIEQILQFAETYGIKAGRETAEVFVEEYSTFPGVPAL